MEQINPKSKSEKQICFTEGYWASDIDPKKDEYKGKYPWPFPSLFPEKEIFLEKLSKIEQMLNKLQLNAKEEEYVLSYRGLSRCRLCNNLNGFKEYVLQHSNGKVNWPEGFSHYVDVHGVRPTEQFIQIIFLTKIND
jgi:hypothetical protein